MNAKRLESARNGRRLTQRIWRIVMFGGELLFLMLLIAMRLPVHSCIIGMFVFSGIWVFLSDKITDLLLDGVCK